MLCGCSVKNIVQKDTVFALDTVIDLTVCAPDRKALTGAETALLNWEKKFSAADENSEIGKLNGGDPAALSAETLECGRDRGRDRRRVQSGAEAGRFSVGISERRLQSPAGGGDPDAPSADGLPADPDFGRTGFSSGRPADRSRRHRQGMDREKARGGSVGSRRPQRTDQSGREYPCGRDEAGRQLLADRHQGPFRGRRGRRLPCRG